MLTWATYTDLRWRVIPNYISIIILLIACYLHYINGTWVIGLIGLIIASILFIPHVLGQIGGGDVKLFLALGFYFGLGIILLLFIVLVLSALFFIFKWLKGAKRINVPLAPFILTGYFILGGVVFAAKVFY